MLAANSDNNLISIDDVILRARGLGIDFGKGDPRERLRYLTKIGLLPHAQRKSFKGEPPNGAYPEYVIELLLEIDREIRAGKSIQELKKEKERKSLLEAELPALKIPGKGPAAISPALPKTASTFQTVFLILISAGIILFLSAPTIKEDFYPYLSASFNWIQKLAQVSPAPVGQPPETREIFLLSSPEPYLTINAPTDVHAPFGAQAFTLLRDEFRAALVSQELTDDRTYTLPDDSGIVCLSTGNCVGVGGGVFSVGGIANRLAKFTGSQEIGISSVADFYAGVALTIDSAGRVGVGLGNPSHPLHVAGRIQATGDICTNLVGGRCLSTLPLGGAPPPAPPPAAAGIDGSGTTNYLPIWTAGTTLGNSIIYQSGSKIGIGTTSPGYTLDVYGTTSVRAFVLPTGAASSYVLTADASGIGTWQPATGTLPAGTDGQTLRHNGTSWIANSFLYNSGSAVGIGTTTTPATLTLSGNAIFATTTLPQLALRYDSGNYLNFAIDTSQSLVEASKKMVLNSLTGEIKLGSNVNLFDAFVATVRGATFISTTTDSTVRKSGELVLRASLPIFRFGVPAQTTSTVFTTVSKTFSPSDSLSSLTPSQLPGTQRVYAFLINFADNIATTASSTWRVYRPTAATTTLTFQFTGQNLSSLETGNPHLTATTTLPNNDWRVDVQTSSTDKSMRIFSIFLLTFDQIN
jgi:hypothetical protein